MYSEFHFVQIMFQNEITQISFAIHQNCLKKTVEKKMIIQLVWVVYWTCFFAVCTSLNFSSTCSWYRRLLINYPARIAKLVTEWNLVANWWMLRLTFFDFCLNPICHRVMLYMAYRLLRWTDNSTKKIYSHQLFLGLAFSNKQIILHLYNISIDIKLIHHTDFI